MSLTLTVEGAALEDVRRYELEEARLLQQAMIPTEPLRTPQVEVFCEFRPVDAVGGDFLDYFVLSDNTVGFYLGDVVGKGLPAALYAALAVGTLRGIHKTGVPPGQVLGLMNRRLRARGMPGRYCAAQYGVLDPATRVLRYANAGLPYPQLISKRGCKPLGQGGLPVGLFDHAWYETTSVQLEPGDAAIFFTDGLSEVCDGTGRELDREEFAQFCAPHRGKSGDQLIRAILGFIEGFAQGQPPRDDTAVAVLKIPDRAA